MKLDHLAFALDAVSQGFDVDATDLLIISSVIEKNKTGDVYTMKFIKEFKSVSQATVHARMKKLIDKGLLARTGDEKNLRVKKLQPTDKTEELVKFVESI